jgi:hypothetical protein
MREHRDELAALLSDAGRSVDWETLAIDFGRAGLRDARGSAATAPTARKTWSAGPWSPSGAAGRASRSFAGQPFAASISFARA